MREIQRVLAAAHEAADAIGSLCRTSSPLQSRVGFSPFCMAAKVMGYVLEPGLGPASLGRWAPTAPLP